MANKKITLKDSTQTDNLYPATFTSQVFNEDGVNVDTLITDLSDDVGDLSNLTTTNKSNLVSAINEVNNPEIKTIALSNGSDHSFITNEYTVSLKKVGKLCILNLDIKFGTVSGNQCIGYVVPVGARPSFTARSVMTQWKSNAYSTPLSITNEGLVSMAYVQSNTEYSGQAVWFCE